MQDKKKMEVKGSISPLAGLVGKSPKEEEKNSTSVH